MEPGGQAGRRAYQPMWAGHQSYPDDHAPIEHFSHPIHVLYKLLYCIGVTGVYITCVVVVAVVVRRGDGQPWQ